MRRAGPGTSRCAGGPEGSDWEGGKGEVRPPTRSFVSFSPASRAARGQAKASGAPMKRTRRARAKASQALKLRNSAKGKVPKSALGECFAWFGGSAFEAGLQTLPEKTVEIVGGQVSNPAV